jgi:signal transduction histidine kinase
LVSNIPVGVYVLHSKPDSTFALDYVSPKMAKMVGLSVESLMSSGDIIVKAIHPDDQAGFVRMNQEGIQQIRPFDWKGRAVIEGDIRWLHISSLPQELDCGDILWNGLVVDITEQMQAKAEIEHQNAELQKTNAEKDKFFSIIAHDLRSPFNGFLGITQLMAEELPSLSMAEIQNIAKLMHKSASNIYRLLNNLLEWSQIQQGAILFNPKVIQLKVVVSECIGEILELSKSKEIEIETNIHDGLIVFADENMLKSILRNLLSNAIKFTPRGGKINFAAKICGNKSVEISIRDTGIGMSQILLDNLFRLDVQTSRKGTDGEPSSGLGLLLCKEFAEKNSGKLSVESEEGNGSTFYFTLPRNNH